jgi:hypothetical protein
MSMQALLALIPSLAWVALMDDHRALWPVRTAAETEYGQDYPAR